MRVGLIGAGNMARAMARGWGDPVLVSDTGSGRAQALVDELGGEAFSSNVEVASRAELVILCHKPYHLDPVAAQIRDHVKIAVSVLGGTSTSDVQRAYPDAQVFSLMPNTPVEIGQGAVVYAQADRRARTGGQGDKVVWETDPAVEKQILALFERLGRVIAVPEQLMDAATSISGVGPAYQALLAEAQIDAAVRHGLQAAVAADLVIATMGGSAALIAKRDYDTLAIRREVTSPGGSTARGLDALERSGIRTAFQDAIDAVVRRKR